MPTNSIPPELNELLEDVLRRVEDVEDCLHRFSRGDFTVSGGVGGGVFAHLEQCRTGARMFIEDMEAAACGNLEHTARDFGEFSRMFNRILNILRQTTDQIVQQYLDVERMAVTDPLSGVYSRGALMRRLQEEVVRANRYDKPLCVILMDLDDFKKVNDAYGHQMGDEVLKRLGNILNRHARQTDLVGRYGGEEFLVLATETEVGNVGILADRVREEMAAQVFECGDGSFSVTVSQGVAGKAPCVEASVQSLLLQADSALYTAKRAGKNRAAFCPFSRAIDDLSEAGPEVSPS